MESLPSPASARISVWLERLSLLLMPLLLYGASLHYGLLFLDDQLYYQHNPALHGGSLAGLRELWSSVYLSDYAPVSNITLWLDLALFGDHSFAGARVHGLLWLGLGALCVRELMFLVTERRGLAFTIAALYALHPLCAPSALWLAERKNLVSFALSYACIGAYVLARRGERVRVGAYAAALALCVLALLAKVHAVAIPAMLAAYELFLGRGAWARRAAALAPFALLAAAFVAINLLFLREDLARPFLGGSRLAAAVSDGPVLLRYLGHVFDPTGLTLYYYVPGYGAASPWALGAGLAFLGTLAAVIGLARDRRRVCFGWSLGLAALAPALNLVPQLAPMADHYVQWALPGWLLATALVIDEQLQVHHLNRLRAPLVLGSALFLALFSALRMPEFSSRRAMFEAAVVHEPRCSFNWASYAETLADSRENTDAQTSGMAALQALQCPDARRLMPQQRALAIRAGALLLFRSGRAAEAWEMTERECALFDAGGQLFARLTEAEVGARTDHPRVAVELLEGDVTPPMRAAMQTLRAATRDGSKAPTELPPILGMRGTGSDAYAQEWGGTLGMRTLQILGYAYLALHEDEKGYDIGALITNTWPENSAGQAILAVARKRLGITYRAAQR